jgi:hypothetical protein
LLTKYIKCNVWRLAVRYDVYIYIYIYIYVVRRLRVKVHLQQRVVVLTEFIYIISCTFLYPITNLNVSCEVEHFWGQLSIQTTNLFIAYSTLYNLPSRYNAIK